MSLAPPWHPWAKPWAEGPDPRRRRDYRLTQDLTDSHFRLTLARWQRVACVIRACRDEAGRVNNRSAAPAVIVTVVRVFIFKPPAINIMHQPVCLRFCSRIRRTASRINLACTQTATR